MTERDRMVRVVGQVRRIFIDNGVGLVIQRIANSRRSDLVLDSGSETHYWGALWADAKYIEQQELDKKRVYISGPMTGYEDFNRPAFHAMAAKLEADGHLVENPATVQLDKGEWSDYMKVDLAMLLECDFVVVLPGWQQSPGARLEVTVAHSLGIPVKTYPELIDLVEKVELRIFRTYDGLLI